MEGNNSENKRPILTFRNIIRLLVLLGFALGFCPQFLVSCSGQDVPVSAWTGVTGIKVYGEKVVDPHPVLIILFLIPLAVFVIMSLRKNIRDREAGIIAGAGSLVSLIVWIIFSARVKAVAKEAYCQSKTTLWFFIELLLDIGVIAVSVIVEAAGISLDTDLIAWVNGGGLDELEKKTRSSLNRISDTAQHVSEDLRTNKTAVNAGSEAEEDRIGFCTNCGNTIIYGDVFCTGCGTKVPDSMTAEAEARKEAERKAQEEARQRAEEEARRKAEEEARQKAEEEARRKAEEEARQKAEEELRKKIEEELRQKAEEEAKMNDQEAILAGEVRKMQAEAAEEKHNSAPKFCMHCGTRLDGDAKFCHVCGKPAI